MPKKANPSSSALRMKMRTVAVEEPQRLEIAGHRHRIVRRLHGAHTLYKMKSRRVNRRASLAVCREYRTTLAAHSVRIVCERFQDKDES